MRALSKQACKGGSGKRGLGEQNSSTDHSCEGPISVASLSSFALPIWSLSGFCVVHAGSRWVFHRTWSFAVRLQARGFWRVAPEHGGCELGARGRNGGRRGGWVRRTGEWEDWLDLLDLRVPFSPPWVTVLGSCGVWRWLTLRVPATAAGTPESNLQGIDSTSSICSICLLFTPRICLICMMLPNPI